jgi:ribonuclease HI
MLQKPILSGRLGRWAYSLVEYDLKYEPLKAMRGHVVEDFIIDHSINVDDTVCLAHKEAWKLFFDGSICGQGQGAGCVIVSPNGMEYEASTRLEFRCTNNQAEYETLLIGLELIVDMGTKSVEIFGDSQLMVQQISSESQCLDGTLNEYRERCLYILRCLESFSVGHMPQESNVKANTLAQQASKYDVRWGKFQAR